MISCSWPWPDLCCSGMCSRRGVRYETKLLSMEDDTQCDRWLNCCTHAVNELSGCAACVWPGDTSSPDLTGTEYEDTKLRFVQTGFVTAWRVIHRLVTITMAHELVQCIASGSYSWAAAGINLSWVKDILREGFLHAHVSFQYTFWDSYCIAIFYVTTPWCLIHGHQRFRGSCCLRMDGRSG